MKIKFSIFHSPFSSPRGFTLIEALLVIALIGVLAAAFLRTFNPFEQIRKANDSKRKADIASVQRALELYYQDFGSYPQSSGTYTILTNSVTRAWGGPWNPYMAKLPDDPIQSNSYVYYSPPSSSGQTYYIYANLERGRKDSQVCNAGNACSSLSQAGFPGARACGGTCNYGVSSPNVSP